jgi:hypothetical protein
VTQQSPEEKGGEKMWDTTVARRKSRQAVCSEAQQLPESVFQSSARSTFRYGHGGKHWELKKGNWWELERSSCVPSCPSLFQSVTARCKNVALWPHCRTYHFVFCYGMQ